MEAETAIFLAIVYETLPFSSVDWRVASADATLSFWPELDSFYYPAQL